MVARRGCRRIFAILAAAPSPRRTRRRSLITLSKGRSAMQATVTWDHGLTLSGSADSGFSVPLGDERSVGGDEDGFRPLELMLVSLAGCTGMDVISILTKKRQDVTGFNVQVDAERAEEHPRLHRHHRDLHRARAQHRPGCGRARHRAFRDALLPGAGDARPGGPHTPHLPHRGGRGLDRTRLAQTETEPRIARMVQVRYFRS